MVLNSLAVLELEKLILSISTKIKKEKKVGGIFSAEKDTMLQVNSNAQTICAKLTLALQIIQCRRRYNFEVRIRTKRRETKEISQRLILSGKLYILDMSLCS